MKEKDLEHIFKKELQDFEANPPEHLWDNISKEITPKKTIPLWYIGSGIAASLLLLFGFMLNSSNSNDNNIKDIVTTDTVEYCPEEVLVDNSSSTENNYEEKSTNESSITTLSKEEKTTNNSNPLTSNLKENIVNGSSSSNRISSKKETSIANSKVTKSNLHETVVKENYTPNFSETIKYTTKNITSGNHEESRNTSSKPKYLIDQNTPSKKSAIAFSKYKTNKDTPDKIDQESTFKNSFPKNISPEKDLDNIEELSDTELAALLLNKKDNLDQETKEENTKKWSIQPQVGTYGYTSLNGGSTINSNFNDNPQVIEPGLSYGVRIAYQASAKVKIRTGITFNRIKITTQNIGKESSQSPISESVSYTHLTLPTTPYV